MPTPSSSKQAFNHEILKMDITIFSNAHMTSSLVPINIVIQILIQIYHELRMRRVAFQRKNYSVETH